MALFKSIVLTTSRVSVMKICLLGIVRFISKVSSENKEPAVTVFSGLLQKGNIVQGCQGYLHDVERKHIEERKPKLSITRAENQND